MVGCFVELSDFAGSASLVLALGPSAQEPTCHHTVDDCGGDCFEPRGSKRFFEFDISTSCLSNDLADCCRGKQMFECDFDQHGFCIVVAMLLIE